MGWLFELHKTQPIAHAIGVLTFVCVLGMALGSVKFRGIGLGTSGVLFAGILVGHLGEAVDHQTLDFVKEFGLILFVFTIGLQLGPGFFAALRQQGVRMNVLAAKNRRQVEPLERRTLVVTNPNLEGIRLDAIPGRLESGVATVYPLTALLRILSAQVLAIVLFR